jgi:hypothetical protein
MISVLIPTEPLLGIYVNFFSDVNTVAIFDVFGFSTKVMYLF